MGDYIEREGLIDEISAARDNGGMGAIVAGTLTRYIKRAPAADVRPVVRGRWEWMGPCRDSGGRLWATCSACGLRQRLGDFTMFCPNCGADMRGGSDK